MAKNDAITIDTSEVLNQLGDVKNKLQSLADVLKEIGGESQKISKGGFFSELAGLGGLPGKIKGALLKFNAVVLESFINLGNMVKSTIGKFVGDFAPGNLEVFSNTLRDISATIGEMLLPLLNAANEVFRWIGDTLASVTPIFREFIVDGIAQLRPLFEQIGELIQSFATNAAFAMIKNQFQSTLNIFKMLGSVVKIVLTTVQPLIEMIRVGMMPVLMAMNFALMPIALSLEVISEVVRVLMMPLQQFTSLISDTMAVLFESINEFVETVKGELLSVVKMGTDALAELMSYFKKVFDYIRQLLGIESLKMDGSSFGKAAGQGSTTTISSLLSKMDAAAFGAAQSHAEQTAKNTMESASTLANILNAVSMGAEYTKRVYDGVVLVNSTIGNVIDKVAPSADNFGFAGQVHRQLLHQIKSI